ncbi:kinase-like protein [Schizophyllum commune]
MAPPPTLSADDFYFDSMGTTEDIVRYCPGGYHPVTIGDILSNGDTVHGTHGSYRVMHKLGFGSYATVWLGQRVESAAGGQIDASSGGFVSLKVTIASESDKEVEMLELASGAGNAASEGKGGEGLSHVLTLLDKFEHRGPNGVHSVIVTDVVAPLLSFHISRRLPRWRKVAAYGLAKAMAQLHAAGVVHGDLHLGNVGVAMPQLAEQDPSDVMQDLDAYELTVVLPVDPANQTPSLPPYVVKPCDLATYHDKIAGEAEPQTKLFDFGNAHRAGTLPIAFQCAPEACSPEVAFARVVEKVRNPPAEPPSDIWALGASIYEIVTGSSLFHGVGINGIPQCAAAMSATLPPSWKTWWESTPRPPPNPDAWWTEHWVRLRVGCASDEDAEALARLLRKILVLEPEKRPSAAEIVGDEWFRDAA